MQLCFNIGNAQRYSSLQFENETLKLKGVGSFYVGGEQEEQTALDLGGYSTPGSVTVHQMYVNFMIPKKRKHKASVVMIHGMNLSGKTYETVPDGSMGWYEYFVRKGFATYTVDQVGAGRSGFNQKAYNQVQAGKTSAGVQQIFHRISDDNSWINFRFGLKNGDAVAHAQYDKATATEFSKQSIPFSLFGLPDPNPNYLNLSTLAKDLKAVVLMSHSQSGSFPIETALLDAQGIQAIIMLEPGGTGDNYNDQQVAKLKDIPVLVLFGDYLTNETGLPGHSWQDYYEGWQRFTNRLEAAGGTATTLKLTDLGFKGNSHMLMQDRNNQQIADYLIKWITENTE